MHILSAGNEITVNDMCKTLLPVMTKALKLVATLVQSVCDVYLPTTDPLKHPAYCTKFN